PALVKQRPDLTMDMIDKFLTRMYVTNADFVFSVPRAVVAGCQVPVLVMPDETPAHPYEPAIESAMLAPKAAMTFFPWKDTKEQIPRAVRHGGSFLKANRPACPRCPGARTFAQPGGSRLRSRRYSSRSRRLRPRSRPCTSST